MTSIIDRRFRQAWLEGAKEGGGITSLDELTPQEQAELVREISTSQLALPHLAAFINNKSRANGFKFAVLRARLSLWINLYNRVRTIAAAMASANRKKMWELGATEEHCESCFGFDGRVYRASTWFDNGAMPQSRALCCHGYNCDCRLVDTDKRITPGRFPAKLLCGE